MIHHVSDTVTIESFIPCTVFHILHIIGHKAHYLYCISALFNLHKPKAKEIPLLRQDMEPGCWIRDHFLVSPFEDSESKCVCVALYFTRQCKFSPSIRMLFLHSNDLTEYLPN